MERLKKDSTNPTKGNSKTKPKHSEKNPDTSKKSNKVIIHNGYYALGVIFNALSKPFSVNDALSIIGNPEELHSSDIIYLCEEHLEVKCVRKKLTGFYKTKIPTPLMLEWGGGEYRILKSYDVEKKTFIVSNPQVEKQEELSEKDFLKQYGGHALFFKNERQFKEDSFTEQFGFKSIFFNLMENKKVFFNLIAAALLIQFFVLITPLFTMIVIDKVFSSSGLSTLNVLIVALFAINLFDFVIGNARKNLLSYETNRIDTILLSRIFRHFSHLPLSFFENKQTGDMVARIKDIESIRNFVTGQTLTIFIDFPFTIIFLMIMYWFSPLLTGVVFLAIVIFFLLFGVMSPFLKKNMQKKHQVSTDNQSFLFEMISNIKTIKSIALERQIQKKWENHVVDYSKNSSATESIQGNINQIAGWISKMVVAVCLWIGAVSVLNGVMTAGQLIAFNMLVGRVVAPIQRMAQLLQQLAQVKISMKRVREIFCTPMEVAYQGGVSQIPEIKGEIEFRDVSFTYHQDHPYVLENISFKVSAGEVIGIIGSSGSGKTSLIKLLLRLYLSNKGKIIIDGLDTKQVDPVKLRNYFGVVEQDNTLFNMSIKENIALYVPNANFDLIENMAKVTGADSFIRKLPKGYDTVVGEKGHLLSNGERQRIAISRALLKKPKILILDEATTFLDYESEMILQKNMDFICRDRTVFIVSHRISALRKVNRILTLERGKLVENDTPKKLLVNEKSRFHELYRLQKVEYVQ